jgi:hypothetical protein
MTAGILDRVEQLQVLAKKHDRRLKDIHVWCQWAISKLDGAHDATDSTEYSVSTATQAYTSGDLRNLLHSSGSVLSLQIGDLSDDSISMIWTPDSESAISSRRVKSVLSPVQPTPEDLQRARGIVIDTYVSQQLGSSSRESPLQNLADLFKLAERSRSRRSRQVLMNSIGKSADLWHAIGPVVRAGGQLSPFFPPFVEGFFFFEKLVVNAKENHQSIMDDLTEIRDLMNAINFVGRDREIEEELCDLKDRVFKALSEYMEHATEVFKARTSMLRLRPSVRKDDTDSAGREANHKRLIWRI